MVDEAVLLEVLRGAKQAGPTPGECKCCWTLAHAVASKEVRDELASALHQSSSIGVEPLSKLLSLNGMPLSTKQIYKHRREGHA